MTGITAFSSGVPRFVPGRESPARGAVNPRARFRAGLPVHTWQGSLAASRMAGVSGPVGELDLAEGLSALAGPGSVAGVLLPGRS